VRLSSRNAWREFQASRGLDAAQDYAFFQAIDKLEREDPSVTDATLHRLGSSLNEVRDFIAEARPTQELAVILADLEARGLSAFVRVDYGVIRGLAYYTGPVFEAFDRKGEFRAIAGGGRYDQLVKLVSGGKVDLPGLGFGMGDVVLAELLKARRLVPTPQPAVDVYCVIEQEELRPASLRVVQVLREAGWSVDFPLVATKPDKQFKRALEVRAARTVRLIAGAEGLPMARVRDLATRAETDVAHAALAEFLGRPGR
jgi:histidyl-tRNA synthetase